MDLKELVSKINFLGIESHKMFDEANYLKKMWLDLCEGKNEEYDFSKFDINTEYNFVDLGANIGIVTLFLALKFPKSKIISIEPDKKAFGVLKENINNFNLNDRVIVYNKAISNKKKTIDFFSIESHSVGSFSMNKNQVDLPPIVKKIKQDENKLISKTQIETITLKQIMKQHKLSNIDILKCDIEGAEYDLFDGRISVYKKIKNIYMETHGLPFEQYKLFFKLKKRLKNTFILNTFNHAFLLDENLHAKYSWTTKDFEKIDSIEIFLLNQTVNLNKYLFALRQKVIDLEKK